MTLDATLLQKLNNWKPTSAGRQALAVNDDGTGWSVVLTADRADEMSCLVWDMTIRRTAGAVSDLGAWAKAAAAQVTGLLEPLRVVEVDAPRSEAQLRSQQPSQRGENRFYYEVLLTGGGQATLRRYQAGESNRREQVAFPLTHEALAKVAADLTTGV